jgi:hypothetical protein
VDAFGRRSFELRPPIAAARKDFHSRISRFVGDVRQFLRSAPSLRTRYGSRMRNGISTALVCLLSCIRI